MAIYRHKTNGQLIDGTVLGGPVVIDGVTMGAAGDVRYTNKTGGQSLITAAVIAAMWDLFDPQAIKNLVVTLEANGATQAQVQNALAKVIRILNGAGLL